MSKKKSDAIIEHLKTCAAQDRASLVRQMTRAKDEHRKEIETRIEPMVKKFLRVCMQIDPIDFAQYRVVTEMDARWVEQCLIHGNSESEIKHLVYMISHQVGYEMEKILKTKNFQRVSEFET